MVPDKFNMVDMGGIDLIMMQGEEVPGLYNRLVESIAQCRYQCLYNWLFDGVIIPPTYVEMEIGLDEEVRINEGVIVTSDDVIHIYTIDPPAPEPPVIIPLLAEENGTYNAPADVDGFNPVTVDVPSYTPVIESLSVTENGTYTAPSGVDGYSPIAVNVPDIPAVVQPLSVTQNGTYNPPSGVDGYAPVTVDVSGGGSEHITLSPIHYDTDNGYIYGSTFYYSPSSGYRDDVFALESNKHYIIHLGSVVGNRFRVGFFTDDPGIATTNLSGVGIISIDNPSAFALVSNMFTPSTNGYLMIVKTNASVNDLKSYVVEFNEN